MTVIQLIRELTELAETYGKHVNVRIPSPYRSGEKEQDADEVKYEQAEIHIR